MSGSTGPSGLDIADHMVRYLSADTHPDHDSIGKFRRESKELLASAFHQVLELAASAKELKVGGSRSRQTQGSQEGSHGLPALHDAEVIGY